eukprot:TRINITY_DN6379_c1_g1_i3.p1 TRINITY_DN6379_c1_g1~~TRINITY_DN6379_c1_g1_i3.p1  ORF type:complete len:1578 (+),score=503.47 TRINITY_DN6379_c1_g1_i3:316-5049(+)
MSGSGESLPDAAAPAAQMGQSARTAVRELRGASPRRRGAGGQPAAASGPRSWQVAFDSPHLAALSALTDEADVRVNAKSLSVCVERVHHVLHALLRGAGYQGETTMPDGAVGGDGQQGSESDRQYINLLISQERLLLGELQAQQVAIARLQHDEGRAQRLLQDYREEHEAHRHVADQHEEALHDRDCQIEALKQEIAALIPRARDAERSLEAASTRVPLRTPLSRLSRHVSFRNARGSDGAPHAPTGAVTLAFTDIQGSTKLWEMCPGAMRQSLHTHNTLMRSCIQHYLGYEVKTVGDAFMITFCESKYAVACALSMQLELAAQEWPEDLKAQPDCVGGEPAAEGEVPALPSNLRPGKSKQEDPLRLASGEVDPRQLKEVPSAWNGLRVRIGLNQGRPICEIDPCTGRMDYFGPVVNKSARVEAQALGGMVAATREVADAVLPHLETLGCPVITPHDTVILKGIAEPVEILRILPRQLSGRNVFYDQVLEERRKQERERRRQQQRENKRRRRRELAEIERSLRNGPADRASSTSTDVSSSSSGGGSSDGAEAGAALSREPSEIPQQAPPSGNVTFVLSRIAHLEEIKQQLITASRRASVDQEDGAAAGSAQAPSGWESLMDTYTSVMRRTAEDVEAPYFRVDGDRALLACEDPVTAVSFCLLAQERLQEATWPQLLDSLPMTRQRQWRGTVVQKGARVQMGIHSSTSATPITDPFSKFATYLGGDVAIAGDLAAYARGGQMILSEEVYDGIVGKLGELHAPVVNLMGTFEGKFNVFQCYPRSLVGRLFLLMGFDDSDGTRENEEYKSFKQQLVAEEAKRVMVHGPSNGPVVRAFGRDITLITTVQGAILAKLTADRTCHRRRKVDSDLQAKVELLETHRMAAEDTRLAEDMYLLPPVTLTLQEVGIVVDYVAKGGRRRLRSLRPAPSVDLGRALSRQSSVRSSSRRSSCGSEGDLSGKAEESRGSPAIKKRRAVGARSERRAQRGSEWRSEEVRAEREAERKREDESREALETLRMLRGRLTETLSSLLSTHKYVRHFCGLMRSFLEQERLYDENDLVLDWVTHHYRVQEDILGQRAKKAKKGQSGHDFRTMTMFAMGAKEEQTMEMLRDPTKMARSVLGHLATFIEWAKGMVRRRQTTERQQMREMLQLKTKASVAQGKAAARKVETPGGGGGTGWQSMLRSAGGGERRQTVGEAGLNKARMMGALAVAAKRRLTAIPGAEAAEDPPRRSTSKSPSTTPLQPQLGSGRMGRKSLVGSRLLSAARRSVGSEREVQRQASAEESPGYDAVDGTLGPRLSSIAPLSTPLTRGNAGGSSGRQPFSRGEAPRRLSPTQLRAVEVDSGVESSAAAGSGRALSVLRRASNGQSDIAPWAKDAAQPAPDASSPDPFVVPRRDSGGGGRSDPDTTDPSPTAAPPLLSPLGANASCSDSSPASPSARWRTIATVLRAVGQAQRVTAPGPATALAAAAVEQVCNQVRRQTLRSGGPPPPKQGKKSKKRLPKPAACEAVEEVVAALCGDEVPQAEALDSPRLPSQEPTYLSHEALLNAGLDSDGAKTDPDAAQSDSSTPSAATLFAGV